MKVVKENLHQILDYEIEIDDNEYISIKELINYYKMYKHMIIKEQQIKTMNYQELY